MTESFSLQDPRALVDLQTYLARAARADNGAARVIADGGVLAVYTALLYPRGLLDAMPTVLGLRTFATEQATRCDTVVPLRSFLDRVARVRDLHGVASDDSLDDDDALAAHGGLVVGLPLPVATVTWAAISPPRGGWREVARFPSDTLIDVSRAGVAEISEAIPTGTGDARVHWVRSDVWSRPIPDLSFVPGGAGFAADVLGFLVQGEQVTIFENGSWTRLSTKRGHTLVYRPAWSLSA